MNKIYAFIVIIPLIATFLFKSLAFYDFDTRQRYIKNAVDNTAHKVMITGVMTASDRDSLLNELRKLGEFEEESIVLKSGYLEQDALSCLEPYSLGNVLDRGEIFSIYVQSAKESMISEMERNTANENHRLCFKAAAVCRIEKKQEDL